VPESTGMTNPVAVERDGILYLVGIRDGHYRIRRSADCGQSWLPYSDDAEEHVVAPATCEQRAGLVKLTAQGRPLLACIPAWPDLLVYRSFDDGETWELESSL
jgi:hypothetical protein